MIDWKWTRTAAEKGAAPNPNAVVGQASAADGERIYAFGDVHGRHDLLSGLFHAIRTDMESVGRGMRATVIGLGDYIDRGPDSMRVLELLTTVESDGSFTYIGLQGNHEAVLLRALEGDAVSARTWMLNGGASTLESYGIRNHQGQIPARVLQELASRLPYGHVAFLRQLDLSHTSGDYFFAHAGASPGIPLQQQSARDLLYASAAFHEGDAAHEKVIVHGHWIVDSPDVRRHRINVDTGAYRSGCLTCVVIEGRSIRFLQSKSDSSSKT